MGQLAAEIKSAAAADEPAVTPEMAKEALGDQISALTEKYAPSKLYKDFDDLISTNLPGMSVENRSLINAALIGIGLGLPSAGLVALLKRKAHQKAEDRRKKLTTEYLDITSPKRDLLLPPSEMDVPVKAAMEKKAVDPWMTALVAALLGPPAYSAIKSKLGGIGLGEWAKNLFKVTDSPFTHPLGPSIILGAPVAAMGLTSHLMDKRLDKVREERMKREREKAEAEFQQSLEAEYQHNKASSLAESVDNLAEQYTSSAASQLTKEASGGTTNPYTRQQAAETGSTTGVGNMLFGLWLASILALTGASSAGAWQYAESTDKGRQRSKALARLLKRRALATPPPLSIVRQEEPAKKRDQGEEPV
jgi:hypothetical protein